MRIEICRLWSDEYEGIDRPFTVDVEGEHVGYIEPVVEGREINGYTLYISEEIEVDLDMEAEYRTLSEAKAVMREALADHVQMLKEERERERKHEIREKKREEQKNQLNLFGGEECHKLLG